MADPNDEIEDKDSSQEEVLGPVDEHKSIIMHLLSQLKLGMDLTKVGSVARCLAKYFIHSYTPRRSFISKFSAEVLSDFNT